MWVLSLITPTGLQVYWGFLLEEAGVQQRAIIFTISSDRTSHTTCSYSGAFDMRPQASISGSISDFCI